MTKAQAAAARWFAIMHGAPADHPDRPRFEAWLAADPAHAAAFAALTRVWGQLNSSAADIKILADSVERHQNDGVRKRRRVLKQGMLGLLLLGCTGGIASYQWRTRAQWRTAYRSKIGETHALALDDGSTVVLGADSGIGVEFSRTERHATLTQGQAVFDVAPDAARPFVIDGGPLRITVVGTRFAVERLSNRVRVSVDHGTVKLSTGPFWRRREIILSDGQVADLIEATDVPPSFFWANRPATDGFAFLRGQIIFNRADLEEIAETLSRYRRKPVRTTADTSSSPPITAVVQLDDISAFLRSLSSIYPVTVTESEGQTWLACRPR